MPAGFFTIWTTVAIDLVGFGIMIPLLPQYAEKLGASPAAIGGLVASFSVAQLLFAPLWGRLSDRIGRKPVLVVSLFGTAVGSLLTGLAGSVWLLFAARVLDGASGASVSVAQAAASDLAPARDRPRLMGLLGAAFGVGFVAGPALGALGALGGPQVPFFLAALIAFANGVIAIGRLPETSVTHQMPDTAGDDAERIAASLAVDGPGLVEPAHLERPPPEARSAIVRLIVVAFVAMVAFSGFEATFSLLGERRFGFTMATTGAVFTFIGLGLVAVQSSLIGPANEALGEKNTLRTGLGCNAAGFVVLALGGGWLGLVIALAFLVVGQGLLSPTLASAVAARAGEQRGQWLGWQQSASGLARVIGPLVAGYLFGGVGTSSPFAVGAVLVVSAVAFIPRNDVFDARPLEDPTSA